MQFGYYSPEQIRWITEVWSISLRPVYSLLYHQRSHGIQGDQNVTPHHYPVSIINYYYYIQSLNLFDFPILLKKDYNHNNKNPLSTIAREDPYPPNRSSRYIPNFESPDISLSIGILLRIQEIEPFLSSTREVEQTTLFYSVLSRTTCCTFSRYYTFPPFHKTSLSNNGKGIFPFFRFTKFISIRKRTINNGRIDINDCEYRGSTI